MSGEFDQGRSADMSTNKKEPSFAWGDPNDPRNEGRINGWLDAEGCLTPAGQAELDRQRDVAAAKLTAKLSASKPKAASAREQGAVDKHGIPIVRHNAPETAEPVPERKTVQDFLEEFGFGSKERHNIVRKNGGFELKLFGPDGRKVAEFKGSGAQVLEAVKTYFKDKKRE